MVYLVYCLTNLSFFDILLLYYYINLSYTNQRVTSYELIPLWIAFIARVTSYFYCTSYELLLAYELQVIVYCTSYELLFTARVTSCFLHTSYEVLLIARVTNYFLYATYELQVIARVTSYFLCMSYKKDKDDKTVYDNKVKINNYSLRTFFDKELDAR